MNYDAYLAAGWSAKHDAAYVCVLCGEIEIPEGDEWCESCGLHGGDDE